jgi:hypothetical protein
VSHKQDADLNYTKANGNNNKGHFPTIFSLVSNGVKAKDVPVIK